MKQQTDQTVTRPHTGSHPYLDALFANGKLVKAEDGRLDDVDRRQDGHTDVDGVTPLGVQNQNLGLLGLRSFLHTSDMLKTRGVRQFSCSIIPPPALEESC